jgi:hypothetical protein
MKIKIAIYKYILLISFISFSSCETLDLDQLEDPSAVSTKFLDPNLAFNFVQLELPKFVYSANQFTQRVTRQMAMTGGNTYENAFVPNDFNNNWKTGYNILSAIKKMEPKAIENENYYILGASHVIRCYILLTMTDMYGDIPVKEALLGNANLYPKFDKDYEVYKIILVELDEAIAQLSRSSSKDDGINDIYYGGKTEWVTLANTLKLKMYFTARQAGSEIGIADIAGAMQSIIASGNYIDTPSKDFVFQYGTSRTNPNARHPDYNDQYELGGGAYLANYMMWAMTTEKGFIPNPDADTTNPTNPALARRIDPRINYFFYKQTPNPAALDKFELPGLTRPPHYNDPQYSSFFDSSIATCYSMSHWTFGNTPASTSSIGGGGYLGRDHGNNSGIPPDAELRTVVGVYPAGGKFGSDGKSVQRSGIDGAKGAGIMPILLSSWVHFMKAEAILTISLPGDAKTEFLAGVNQSLDKTTAGIGIYPELSTNQKTKLTNNKLSYAAYITDKYDGYNNTKKLELIMKEYFIAAWGNGIEPYNNYRRTGYPSNFQPTLEPVSGDYFYRAYYPLSTINNNPYAPSNSRTKKLFWDKANLNLH